VAPFNPPAAKPAPAGVPLPPVLVPGASPVPPPVNTDALAATDTPPPVAEAGKPLLKLPPPPAAMMKKRFALYGTILALVILGGGGFYAWQVYLAAPPDKLPPPAVRPPVAAKPPAITPSETLNKIAALPANAINKAQDAIAGRREAEQNRIDAAIDGTELPEKRFLDTPLPGELAEPAATRTASQIAPGVTATTTDIVAGVSAGAEFRLFVGNVRINGVFQGTPPRALINGRMFRLGETVEPALGIVFESITAETKTITFKDRTGALVSRRY
jgi:hypothetical protein